ncbi:MAG: hypothetical protein AB8B57_16315 [Congregibacter sp.]
MPLTLLDDWIFVGLLAAAAWALSCVIDVCFVGDGIYREAYEGPAIAGLFCFFPAILTFGLLELDGLSTSVITVALLSGVLFLLHLYFYFSALFLLNDAVNAEVFNTTCVLIVPLLAFWLLGERLSWLNYAAIAVAVCGVFILIGSQATRLCRKAALYLSASVLAASMMMVMQAWVLETASYATSVCLFSTAAFVTVSLACGLRRQQRRRLVFMWRQSGALFVAVQLLELCAVLGSQRATDLSPSVSLVALLECALPILVMAFSFLCSRYFWWSGKASSSALRAALSEQTIAAPSKMASMVLIIVAISLVSA